MTYADGSIETFTVVESDATLEDLFEHGEGNAASQREGYLHRAARRGEGWAHNPELRERWPHEPDYHTQHRWAWNYVRHSLTDYDEMVRHLAGDPDDCPCTEWPLCEPCQGRCDARQYDYGLDSGCKACEDAMLRAMGAHHETAEKWTNARRIGVARWAAALAGARNRRRRTLGGGLEIPPEPYEPPDERT